MRRPFLLSEANDHGISVGAARWKVERGEWQRAGRGVYLKGDQAPQLIEYALATLVATGGVAWASLAGLLHELDSITIQSPFVAMGGRNGQRRFGVVNREVPAHAVSWAHGYRTVDGLHTLLGLASVLDDRRWEHALEAALRKKLVTINELEDALLVRREGNPRIRRVLKLRPKGAPPTESLLETLMVQLIRDEPRLPTPTRQVEVCDEYDVFVARVDLAWPGRGVFVELDGEQHLDQPRYDAARERAVVITTRWLPGRFTWTDVTRNPKTTARTLLKLLEVPSLAAARSA